MSFDESVQARTGAGVDSLFHDQSGCCIGYNETRALSCLSFPPPVLTLQHKDTSDLPPEMNVTLTCAG